MWRDSLAKSVVGWLLLVWLKGGGGGGEGGGSG